MNTKDRLPICIQHFPSPCGDMILASTEDRLCLCDWSGMLCAERNKLRLGRYLHAEFISETSPVLEETKRQLKEYFDGQRHTFSIPLHLVGTAFQKQVWRALLGIPYAETRSYKDIAQEVGKSEGIRAVAQAIGANGICILIPCHRVIGSNRSLTGFSGGIEKKRLLLEMETSPSLSL